MLPRFPLALASLPTALPDFWDTFPDLSDFTDLGPLFPDLVLFFEISLWYPLSPFLRTFFGELDPSFFLPYLNDFRVTSFSSGNVTFFFSPFSLFSPAFLCYRKPPFPPFLIPNLDGFPGVFLSISCLAFSTRSENFLSNIFYDLPPATPPGLARSKISIDSSSDSH